MPTVIDEVAVPNGLVTMTALIDEFLAKGIDKTDIELKLGVTLEAMREAMRSATLEQRIAHGGFRIPRGAMQVIGADGGTEEVIVLIDTCAAEHMAHTSVKMTVTGSSDVQFQGATSRDLVAGISKGNLIVHTKNGPLPMFGVHHVEQIQYGVVIGSFYQFLKYYGQGLGLSLKKEMALFVPTAGRDSPRVRHSLTWGNGLLVVEGVLGVTAVGGTIGQTGRTTRNGNDSSMSRTVLAVNAIHSEPVVGDRATSASVDVQRAGPNGYDIRDANALNTEANMLRAVLAASLLDVVLGEHDIEVAPVVLPPPASASASCSASCDAPTALAVGRGRSLRRQKARPGRRQTSPTVSTKRARTVTIEDVNVCNTTNTVSVPALVLGANGLEVVVSSSAMPHAAVHDVVSSVEPTPAPAGTNVPMTVDAGVTSSDGGVGTFRRTDDDIAISNKC
jgi:hypothetical protein